MIVCGKKNENAHCTPLKYLCSFVRLFVCLFVFACLFVWLFVCLGFFVPLENFSLIWNHQHCRWSAANFDLGTALIAIEKWGGTPTVTRGIRLLWSSHMSRLGFDHPTFKRGERSNRVRPAAVTEKLFLFQCLYILMPVQIFRQHNRYKSQLFMYVSVCLKAFTMLITWNPVELKHISAINSASTNTTWACSLQGSEGAG